MFVYPIFWGCKYTNKIRIINNNPVFQRIILLITLRSPCWYTPAHDAKFFAGFSASQHENQQNTAPKGHYAKFLAVFSASRHKKGRKHRTPGHDAEFSATFPASQHDKAEELANRNTEKRSYGHQKKDNLQTFRLLRKVSVYLGDVRNEGTGR